MYFSFFFCVKGSTSTSPSDQPEVFFSFFFFAQWDLHKTGPPPGERKEAKLLTDHGGGQEAERDI